MKPLLIIPPAPARWPALQELSIHENPLWLEDLEKRFLQGVPGSQDAFAIIPDGGHILACASISKRHDLGVLTRVFAHTDHRRRGLARQVVETLLTWFDMTGGKWLYAAAPADLADGLLAGFSFGALRRAARTPHDSVVMLRAASDVPPDPLTTAQGRVSIHDVTRANWPSLAALLYNRPGADPRAPLDESAQTAELAALELLSRQEAGTCHLKAAFHGPRLVGLASVATEQRQHDPDDHGPRRTYAMTVPHTHAPPQLRDAIVAFARAQGYEKVDFPMETLQAAPADGQAAADTSAVDEVTTDQADLSAPRDVNPAADT